MSNSPLVNHTRISPNRTSPRRDKIRKITIHHMSGNLSVETCGSVFAPSSAQASSNYGVGTDGRVGMYVEERDRAWTSSSPDNDNQAVTIEVANDQIGGNWHVSDTALEKTIELCVDICQRNGIERLNYTGDKLGNLTMHKWFAATDCPGPYLESKFPYIAEQVNKRLRGETSSTTSSSVEPEYVSDAESTIWKFLKDKGFTDAGAAGMMGNLFAESGLKSTNLQNTYEGRLGYDDDSYTEAVDSGSYTNFVHDSAGYGLAQWTYWSRKQGLLEMAQEQGKSIGSLSLQLDYLYQELSDSYRSVLNALETATSVYDASNIVLLQFEKPADQSQSVQDTRAEYSQKYYNKFVSNPVEEPDTEDTSAEEVGLEVGNTAYFFGDTHYPSANEESGKPCNSGVVEITRKAEGKHQFHVKGSGSGSAYGWVDADKLSDRLGFTTTGLHLRDDNSTSANSLGVMSPGSKVWIIWTYENGWHYCYSEELDRIGYCYGEYVDW